MIKPVKFIKQIFGDMNHGRSYNVSDGDPVFLWIDALLSGNYAQGRMCLRDVNSNTFCCLGVACEVYMEDHDDLTFSTERGAYVWLIDEEGENRERCGNGILPGPVREWLGLSSYSGAFKKDSNPIGSLARENDAGTSFNEIANIIAARPEGLFE